ncbi:DUF1653 domain-containing protein [Aliikangiella maris]|uniref:DUF1653 domain-containing protein n=2 Tax=Aliikangiella maris TaxID=3162458 RepID=A0ABV3MUR0_9GAMM
MLSAKNEIVPGKYRHYKGNEYQVVGTAMHSETEELLVLYYPLYKPLEYWVRPFDMFVESIAVNGQMVKRFEFIEPA